jgi:bleomycin hydrolase
MQKIATFAAAIAIVFGSITLSAQEEVKKDEGYVFTTQKECKYTSVKDQHRSGTCWSFSGIGFLECELLRMGRGEYDLADMWIVNRAYIDKAQMYVRMQGKYNFGAGGSFFDVFSMIDKYGIMPQTAYIGSSEGDTLPIHGELDALLKAYVDVIITNPNKTLSPTWKKGYEALVNTYLGEAPAEFTYNGKKYTPTTFAQSLELNMNDFISITSFTHHPFYTKFALEIPDNWIMEESYNLPLNEMMQVINSAVDNGYSVAWGSDVSTKGFNWGKGVAIVPEKDFSGATAGSDRERWEKLSQNEKDKELYTFDKPGKEKTITQEMRQEGFDNWTTTDDHGMVIVGKATDQNGTPYFIVKNSWGTAGRNPYQGFFYASQPFVELQTINFVVHKDAIPKTIKAKLGIR